MRIEQNIYGKNEGREGRMRGRERGGGVREEVVVKSYGRNGLCDDR